MRRLVFLAIATLALFVAGSDGSHAFFAPAELPASLTDDEFWKLSSELSEPNGAFQSDNLISNEIVFERLVPQLVDTVAPGGVYLGVGPEQNFTYIAATKPRFVFITDIRRNNLHLQLMYKALFELSADRAEFIAKLFTKTRPATLTATSTSTEIMNAYWDIVTDNETAYAANLKAIQDHLTKTRSIPVPAEDLAGVASVYRAFYWYGPGITYGANLGLRPAGVGRSYWDLMTQPNSYLSSEETFKVLKELERRNLIVPVVGNFSGPKALRAEGEYLRARNATVSMFYVSNVEGYLRRDGSWPAFCANVGSMPLTDKSVFIRPSGGVTLVTRSGVTSTIAAGGTITPVTGSSAEVLQLMARINGATGNLAGGLVPMAAEVQSCRAPAPAGR